MVSNPVKGIFWSIVSFLSALIHSVIPTYLIVRYWAWLNEFTIFGVPVFTLSLFFLFVYIVSLLVSLIYYAAGVRAIVQRNNEDLGLPSGVKWYGAITAFYIIGYMIFWYFLTGGAIAFFSMRPPVM